MWQIELDFLTIFLLFLLSLLVFVLLIATKRELSNERVSFQEKLKEIEMFWRRKQNSELLALIKACEFGELVTVKSLLNQSKINPNFRIGNEGLTPFGLACKYGHLEIVEHMLTNKNIKVKIVTKEGKDPLMLAVEFGHLKIVEILIEDQRVKIERKSSQGKTIFDLAYLHNQYHILKVLITCPRIQKKWKINELTKIMFPICQHNELDLLQYIVQNISIDINSTDIDGNSFLHIACQSNSIDIIKFLLQLKKTKINLKNLQGETPIFFAYKYSKKEAVKVMLMDPRSEIKEVTKAGWSCFLLSCFRKDVNTMKYFLASGKGINYNPGMLRLGATTEIELLLQKFSENPQKTRANLVLELGLAEERASSLFSMLVLLSDDYFRLQ